MTTLIKRKKKKKPQTRSVRRNPRPLVQVKTSPAESQRKYSKQRKPRLKTPSSARNKSPRRSPVKPRLQAQWDYKAQHSDELSFKKDALMEFITQDPDNAGWIHVKDRLGTIGNVPGPFFRLIGPKRRVKSIDKGNADSSSDNSTGSSSNSSGSSTDSDSENTDSDDNDVENGDENESDSTDSETAPMATRERVVEEIIHTEERYNVVLRKMMHDYKATLEAYLNAKDPILEQAEIQLLFKHIPVLRNVSDALLKDLQQRKSKSKGVGAVFVDFAPYLRVYGQYLSGYRAASKALQAVLADKVRKAKLVSFMAAKQSNLEDLLIQPVQRIPRYELLLMELDKHTEDAHPDKAHISRAIAEVHASAVKNDLTIAQNDLVWQHRKHKSDEMWTSFNAEHSTELSIAQTSGASRVRLVSSTARTWIVDLKAMTRCPALGRKKKQEVRCMLRKTPSVAPKERVVTTPSLVERERSRPTDNSKLRVRVPGVGWSRLKRLQLEDFKLDKPLYFSRTGNKGKWLYITAKKSSWDIGIVQSEDDATDASSKHSLATVVEEVAGKTLGTPKVSAGRLRFRAKIKQALAARGWIATQKKGSADADSGQMFVVKRFPPDNCKYTGLRRRPVVHSEEAGVYYKPHRKIKTASVVRMLRAFAAEDDPSIQMAEIQLVVSSESKLKLLAEANDARKQRMLKKYAKMNGFLRRQHLAPLVDSNINLDSELGLTNRIVI